MDSLYKGPVMPRCYALFIASRNKLLKNILVTGDLNVTVHGFNIS